ncbi:MAG TPA: hypothetical protein VNO30_32730 [Kofleriaceae bacterium]|nr:hypothetical protein [Kofleriaceae bacterium]
MDRVNALSRAEVLECARHAAGSDATAGVETGLMAAMLRQLVLRRGTIQRSRLLHEALEVIGPLLGDTTEEEQLALAETELDALLSLGDLALRQPAPRARIMVEPATPSFIRFGDARELLLLGGSYDGRPMLPARLLERVHARGRARWLAIRVDESIDELCDELAWRGLRELNRALWASTPVTQSADTIIASYWDRTHACALETLTEFEFYDPNSASAYFRGRFRGPDLDLLIAAVREHRCLPARVFDHVGTTAYYVLRDLDGEKVGAHRIDGRQVEARDEWLRLVAAVATRGHRLNALTCGDELFLYFPPPSWLERMLSLGSPRPRSRNALRVDTFSTRTAFEAMIDVMKTKLFIEFQRG